MNLVFQRLSLETNQKKANTALSALLKIDSMTCAGSGVKLRRRETEGLAKLGIRKTCRQKRKGLGQKTQKSWCRYHCYLDTDVREKSKWYQETGWIMRAKKE